MSNRQTKVLDTFFTVINFISILGSILSVIIGMYLVVTFALATTKPSDSSIFASILAVLLFIALSNLDRYRKLRQIDIQSEQTRELIEERIVRQIRADAFFESSGSIDGFYSTASKIDILGITLSNTTKAAVDTLSQRLVAGAHIRFILVSTEENVLDQVVQRSFGRPLPDNQYYKTRIEGTLTLIKIIAGTDSVNGTLEIGLLPYVPSFGIIMIDSETSNGASIVELYHHNSKKSAPKFRLTAEKDPQWFFFFKEQFELMWERCEIHPLLVDGQPQDFTIRS